MDLSLSCSTNMLLRTLHLTIVALAARALAVPVAERASLPPDAPFTISAAQAEALITCPTGFTGAKNGVVFLVHGTGSTGSESWANGPYVKFLPSYGFDVCWIVSIRWLCPGMG